MPTVGGAHADHHHTFADMTSRGVVSSAATKTGDASASTGAVQFESYMNNFTELFGEDLYKLHQSDAHPEMTAVLADCVEAGLLVWGSPLRLPETVG
jgi:hypothetical protein